MRACVQSYKTNYFKLFFNYYIYNIFKIYTIKGKGDKNH